MPRRNVPLIGRHGDLVVAHEQERWDVDILCGICLMFLDRGKCRSWVILMELQGGR
jgi:hypothetical protein